MKDLVNEGRHLQDNFKEKLVKEDPMMSPSITAPSKAIRVDSHHFVQVKHL